MSDTPQVLLAHHLKQLKLPTVLREYDKVARECARDGVDHPRYLLRLIEFELIDLERRTVERRIRAARFPAVKSFDTFDFTAIPTLNKMLVLELLGQIEASDLNAVAGPKLCVDPRVGTEAKQRAQHFGIVGSGHRVRVERRLKRLPEPGTETVMAADPGNPCVDCC